MTQTKTTSTARCAACGATLHATRRVPLVTVIANHAQTCPAKNR